MDDSKVPNWLINASNRIIEHMNDDHSNSIVSTLNAQHGIKDKYAKMEKLQVNGYFALSNQKLYFLFIKFIYSILYSFSISFSNNSIHI